MAALPGYVCNIYLSATASIAFTNLALVDSGDHINFQASNVNPKRYWDPAVPIIVQTAPDGSTWTTITNYTALFCGGKITLPSALAGGTPSVRVSAGNYLPVSFLGDAKSIDIKPVEEVEDVTTFQNPPNPWKIKIVNLLDTDLSLGKYFVDTTLTGYLANRCVIIAYPNISSGTIPNRRYECFAFLKADSIKFIINASPQETLDFTIDGSLNYYTS